MTKVRVSIIIMITTVAVSRSVALAADTNDHREWNYTVSLDGDQIGTHKFVVDEAPGEKGAWHMDSQADFAVTLASVPVFHYHSVVQEQWSHQCLSQLTADTDHNGDTSHVVAQGKSSGGDVSVSTNQPNKSSEQKKWTGCLMTYAYWNPNMRKQTHLLNPESGEIEAVVISPGADTMIQEHGQQISVHVWKVTGNVNPVDVLYDDEGNWVGLDATVKGGRALSYRLQ